MFELIIKLVLLSIWQAGQEALTSTVFSLATKDSRPSPWGVWIPARASEPGSLPWTAFMVPVFPTQCKDRCKWLRYDWNCQTYQGQSYFSKFCVLLFPGSSDSPKFAFVPCSICHWESSNGSIIPGWCYGCWQADCEGWLFKLNTCHLI